VTTWTVTTWTVTLRASLSHDLLLLGRENFLELGFRLFLELGDPFLLIRGELEFFGHELRKEVEPVACSPGSARNARSATGTTPSAGTSRATTILRRRTSRPVIRQRSCGKNGRGENPQRNNEQSETCHGQLLSREPWGRT
jgi:hypothetical protein